MTTLIPKYDQGSSNAINRPFNQKLQETISALDFGFNTTNDAATNATAMLAAVTYALANSKKLTIPSGSYNMNTVAINNATAPNWSILNIEGETSTTAQRTIVSSTNVGVKIITNGVSAFTIDMDNIPQESVLFSNLSIVNIGTKGSTVGISVINNTSNFPRDINFTHVSFASFSSAIHLTVAIGAYGFGTLVFDRVNTGSCSIGVELSGGTSYGVAADLLHMVDCLFLSCASGGVVMNNGGPVVGTIQSTHFAGCEPAGLVLGTYATSLTFIDVSGEATGAVSGKGIIDATTAPTGSFNLNVLSQPYGFTAMPNEYRLNRYCVINSAVPVFASGNGWKTYTPQTVTPVISDIAAYNQTEYATFCMTPTQSTVGRQGYRCFKNFSGYDSGASVNYNPPNSSSLPTELMARYVGQTASTRGPISNISDTYTAAADQKLYLSWWADDTNNGNGFVTGVATFTVAGTNKVAPLAGLSYGPFTGNFVFLTKIGVGTTLTTAQMTMYFAPNYMSGGYLTYLDESKGYLNMLEASAGYPRTTNDIYTLTTGNSVTLTDYGNGSTGYSIRLKIYINNGSLGYYEYVVNGNGTNNTAGNRTYTTIASSAISGVSISTATGGASTSLYNVIVSNTSGSSVTVTKTIKYLS